MEKVALNTQSDAAKSDVIVILPQQLRERADGARSLKVAGSTVRDVIRAVDDRCPGLIFSICYETGELRRFVNVFVGEENIRFLQGMETPIEPGAVVHIIHSVAGG